jgi:hypothetical protein
MKLAIASILAGSAVAFAPQASVSFLSNRTQLYILVQVFIAIEKNENSYVSYPFYTDSQNTI